MGRVARSGKSKLIAVGPVKAGPTVERLKQSAGFFEIGGDARTGYRFQMADSPLGRLLVRQKISPSEYTALVNYAAHWLGAGLAGHVASVDPNRIAAALGPGGLIGSEKVAYHREQYQEAVKALGRRHAFVADQVACHEMRPEQVGQSLGYRSPTRGRDKAVELLREAAAALIDHWNRRMR